MTLQEYQRRLRGLELAIRDLIAAFEAETQTGVEAVDLVVRRTIGERHTRVYDTKVKVEI